MPKTPELLGAPPLDPTPISDLHASVTNKVSKKCPKPLSFMGLRRGFAPGPHANLRSTLLCST